MIKFTEGDLTFSGQRASQLAKEYGTPLYVYDMMTLRGNIDAIRKAIPYAPLSLHFACMANNNIFLLREMRRVGVGVFACTPTELIVAGRAGFCGKEVVFTGSSLSDSEVATVAEAHVTVNADSSWQIEGFRRSGGLTSIGIRVTPELESHTVTLNGSIGANSRMGILESDVPVLVRAAESRGIVINGTHMYVGTNIMDFETFKKPFDRLVHISRGLTGLEYVDIGGGFGVPVCSENMQFNWGAFGSFLSKEMSALSRSLGKSIELKLEPGRAIIASAGVLLTRVTDVKCRRDRVFVGTDTSLSNFARPYVYQEFHAVELADDSLSRNTNENVTICGNTAAANDVFARYDLFPSLRVGDLLAIRNAGAYGMSMSSHFCGRLRPAEVAVDENSVTLIRRRESEDGFLCGQVLG